MRRPAGPCYPQPDDLHIKLTSEAYIRSLREKLTVSTKNRASPWQNRDQAVAAAYGISPA